MSSRGEPNAPYLYVVNRYAVSVTVHFEAPDGPRDVSVKPGRVKVIVDGDIATGGCDGTVAWVEDEFEELLGEVGKPACADWDLTVSVDGTLTYELSRRR